MLNSSPSRVDFLQMYLKFATFAFFVNIFYFCYILESVSDKKDFEILVRDVDLKGPPPF